MKPSITFAPIEMNNECRLTDSTLAKLHRSRKTPWLPLSMLVALLWLSGCGESKPNPSTPASSNPSLSSTNVKATTPASGRESPDIAKLGVDFSKIIGTSETTWLPKAISDLGLESDMTPEAVGERIPGGERVSNFGESDEFVVSEVTVDELRGIEKYKFTFQKDADSDLHGLASVTLVFEPALKAKLSYAQLAQILSRKYGELEPEKLERQEAFWFGPGFAAANLVDRGTDFDGYELEVMMPD